MGGTSAFPRTTGHLLFCREVSHHLGERTPHIPSPGWALSVWLLTLSTATIILTDDDQYEGLRVGGDNRRPGSVRRDSGLEPTPDPEEHAGSHDTNGVSNASAPVETISLFDCVAFNHNSNQKLMFLCHDRVKEFGLHRWGEGREKPVMEMCFALDSAFAIWLTFFS